MPEITLTQGRVALVSEEDHGWFTRWSWCVNKGGYAQHGIRVNGKQRMTYMHRAVMERMLGGPIPKGLEIDHINGNKLDNRRENLRLATRRQNMMNNRGKKDSVSRYKGVSFEKRTGRWLARMKIAGKQTYLGSFVTEEEAARAYDAAARRVHGEFGKLNFPHFE